MHHSTGFSGTTVLLCNTAAQPHVNRVDFLSSYTVFRYRQALATDWLLVVSHVLWYVTAEMSNCQQLS